MARSRTFNTVRNSFWGLITQFVTLILTFINRTIFIRFLSVEYLGCNGLFSNILSMLSLAELGIGTAIVYCLYRPIADNDEQKIKAYMNTYKVAYRVVALIVTLAGFILIPFLPYIIDNTTEISFNEIQIIYVFFLVNNIVSYFFAYKRSLLTATQNEYINSTNTTIFGIVKNIFQIVLLYFTRSYFVYLSVMIACTILSNIFVSYRCDRLFPFLKNNKEKLNKLEVKQLFKYVFAQTSHKVGGIVVSGTDNLLITTMVDNGLYLTGLYSNYLVITNAIKGVLSTVFNSFTGSIGNLNTGDNVSHKKDVFDDLFFMVNFFYGVSTICILCLMQDFVGLWIGNEYWLDMNVIVVMMLNNYITGMRIPCQLYNTTLGLFWNDRFKPWIEAAINLVASIVLLRMFGLIGVFLGTTISTITTSMWIEPYLLYKHCFKMKLYNYFKKYIILTVKLMVICVAMYMFSCFFSCTGWITWFAEALIIGVCSVLLFGLLNFQTPEMKNLITRAKGFVRTRGSNE